MASPSSLVFHICTQAYAIIVYVLNWIWYEVFTLTSLFGGTEVSASGKITFLALWKWKVYFHQKIPLCRDAVLFHDLKNIDKSSTLPVSYQKP